MWKSWHVSTSQKADFSLSTSLWPWYALVTTFLLPSRIWKSQETGNSQRRTQIQKPLGPIYDAFFSLDYMLLEDKICFFIEYLSFKCLSKWMTNDNWEATEYWNMRALIYCNTTVFLSANVIVKNSKKFSRYAKILTKKKKITRWYWILRRLQDKTPGLIMWKKIKGKPAPEKAELHLASATPLPKVYDDRNELQGCTRPGFKPKDLVRKK